jgi:hypothetical protein
LTVVKFLKIDVDRVNPFTGSPRTQDRFRARFPRS